MPRLIVNKFDVHCFSNEGMQWAVPCVSDEDVKVIADIWHFKMGGARGMREWDRSKPYFLRHVPSLVVVHPREYVSNIYSSVRVRFKFNGSCVSEVYMPNCCYAAAFGKTWALMDGRNTYSTFDFISYSIDKDRKRQKSFSRKLYRFEYNGDFRCSAKPTLVRG